eukprot:883479-Alexandrium_andersonii.AAC.1
MSASLVGSEMCIRDRDKATVLRLAGEVSQIRQRIACGLPMVCRGRLGAVSYTHLTLPTICSV